MTHPFKESQPMDYASDQDVRWCPGCGDYAILKAVRQTLSDLRIAPERVVFISGIGCAGRFPYYMQTYGFHTIHGRAAAVATGVAMANPSLDLWITSGDGDSLSIGGNHLLHLLRRNVNLVYLLFNNETYGLTKGQVSPTSRCGTRSPSSPQGSSDEPVNAATFSLGAKGTFIARTVDTFQPHLLSMLKRAHAHQGTGFVEILQNCPIFNDGVHGAISDKKTAPDHLLELTHGEAMIWGTRRDKGLIFNPANFSLEPVQIGSHTVCEKDILRHDETNKTLAWMLATLHEKKDMPVPVGVLYAKPDSIPFTTTLPACSLGGTDDGKLREKMQSLFENGYTWVVS